MFKSHIYRVYVNYLFISFTYFFKVLFIFEGWGERGRETERERERD